jgi:hypothetical protein
MFKGKVRESKDGYYEVSVPPYVVEQENIAKKKVRFRVEEIQIED